MAAPSLVVVLLLGTELGAPGTAELRATAQQALGPSHEVSVASDASEPALARADWVVRLSFDREARRVHLACYLPRSRRRIERDLSFDAADPATERGRTIGFVVASILKDQGAVPGTVANRVSDAAPATPERTAHSGVTSPNVSVTAGIEGAGPGTGNGFGAYAGAGLGVSTWLWLGGAAHGRFGSIPEAQASTRVLAVGPELTLRAVRFGRGWLGLRGSLNVSYLWISHLSDDDIEPDDQARWLPGAELTGHAGLELSPAVAFFADAGATALLGETEIEVRHRVVAVWPWVSGLARFGLQADF